MYDCIVCSAYEWTLDLLTKYPIVTFTLYLRRLPLYYITNLAVPCSILATIAIASFLLHPGCSDRIGISTYVVHFFMSSMLRFRLRQCSQTYTITRFVVGRGDILLRGASTLRSIYFKLSEEMSTMWAAGSTHVA